MVESWWTNSASVFASGAIGTAYFLVCSDSRKHEAGRLKKFSQNGLTAPKLWMLVRTWVGAVMDIFVDQNLGRCGDGHFCRPEPGIGTERLILFEPPSRTLRTLY